MSDQSPVAVDGLAIRCRDLEASTRFYEDALGFNRDWSGKGMVGLTATYRTGTINILLDSVDESAPGTPGVYGVALGITVDDVDAVVDRIRDAGRGVRMEPRDESYGVRNASVFDPDGHEVWISGPLKGSA